MIHGGGGGGRWGRGVLPSSRRAERGVQPRPVLEELHWGLGKISPAVNNSKCPGESRGALWGPRLGGPPGGGHTFETLERFFRGWFLLGWPERLWGRRWGQREGCVLSGGVP